MELKLGDKFKGKHSGNTYEFRGVNNKGILLQNITYPHSVLDTVTIESLVSNYERLDKPEVVKVSILERHFGASVNALICQDFESLERRVIADMVRAHQVENQRRLLSMLRSIAPIPSLIPVGIGMHQLHQTVTGRFSKHSPCMEISLPKTQKEVGSGTVKQMVQGQSTDPKVENKSDGSSADYYKLPANATQLQDLISHKDMNAQMGEIFRATYRYGQASHSDQLRDAKKIKYYIEAEIKRLEVLT